MTGWEVLDTLIKSSPTVMTALLLAAALAAVIVFITGFAQHGIDFIKHGFKQTALVSSFEKRFDDLVSKMATKEDFNLLNAKMATKEDFNILNAKMATKEDLNLLNAKMATKEDFNILNAKIEAIEVNHFGHLKNYLGILNGVLLDKNIIDNETRARLDNELRGM